MTIVWFLVGYILGTLVAWFIAETYQLNKAAAREAALREALDQARPMAPQALGAPEPGDAGNAELLQAQDALRQAQARENSLNEEIQHLRDELRQQQARHAETREALAKASEAVPPAAPASEPVMGYPEDDLTRIKGIGPVLKGVLNDLGITSFRQIAAFTEADIQRVNEAINFPGRIEREDWVGQARDIIKT